MRRWGLALALALSVPIGGCVQTRQYRRRPVHAAAGRLQAAGASARRDRRFADDRRNGRAARRLDRAGPRQHHRRAPRAAGDARRQGPIPRASQRASGRRADELADLERLNFAVAQSIVAPQISRRLSADQARQGPRLDARRGRRRARPEDRLRLCAVPACRGQVASTGRVALGVLGLAGCFVGFCAPNVGGATQLDYASLVDLKTGEVVWFNVVQAGSQVAGIKFGDLRTPARRGADGRAAARPDEAGRGGPPRAGGALMCMRCRAQPPLAAGRRRRRRRLADDRRRPGADPAAGHGPADRSRLQADRHATRGPVAADGAGRGGNFRLEPARSRTRS